MDHRLFYVVGDFLASVALGTIMGLLCRVIIRTGWDMWISMFLMMAVGMVAGMIAFFVVARWLGALEAMVPLMFTGELTGMVVGMMVAMHPMSFRDSATLGALTGIVAIAIIWIANSLLRGITREGKENAANA